jgi:predicted histone-like DNA-binding protein
MALKYRLIQKINPQNPTQPGKFFAHPVTKGEVSVRQLAKEIADISTVSIVDTIAVIESFIQLIPKHLAESEIVRLGDFGSFSIKLISEGAAQEEAFKEAMIKNVKIYFRPGKELKKSLTAIDFEKQ